MPRPIVLKLLKTKDKIKRQQERNDALPVGENLFESQRISHGGQNELVHISSAERKNCQSRILCPVKISFRNEGVIKIFSA